MICSLFFPPGYSEDFLYLKAKSLPAYILVLTIKKKISSSVSSVPFQYIASCLYLMTIFFNYTFKHPSSSIAFVFLPWILPLNMHLLFFVTFSQNLPSSSFLLIFNIFFSLFNILRHLFTPVFPLFLPRIYNSFLDLSTSFLSFSHANSCSLIYSFSFYSEIFTSHFSTIL